MNRRTFFMGAGGALLHPLWGRAEPACPPALWNLVAPDSSADPGVVCPNRITAIPRPNEKVVPFSQIRLPATPRRRPLWSELLRDPNAAKAMCVDLKRGYSELLHRSAADPMDPTGLLHQTWMHDFYCSGQWPGGDLHTTWMFLPWHRAFIFFHERMLAAAIDKPDFRLPIWDWDCMTGIPRFYTDVLGLPSFLTGRYGRQPNAKVDLDQCALEAWLLSQSFTDFCGSDKKNEAMRCQGGPHTVIHTNVVQGAMGHSMTSAADPVFYSHHANVDRFWSHWLDFYGPHEANFERPAQWLDSPMYLYDEQRQLVQFSPGDILDETSLGYYYASMPEILYQCTPLEIPSQLAEWATGLLPKLAALTIASIQYSANTLLDPLGCIRQLRELLEHPEQFAGYLTKAGFKGFPIQVTGNIKGSLEVGQYYYVYLQRTKPERIGGFGVFEHSHRQAGPLDPGCDVAVTGCLKPEALTQLMQGHGNLSLVYGKADPQSTGIEPQNQVRFKNLNLLVPQAVWDTWDEIRPWLLL
jgi:hypothetical protein